MSILNCKKQHFCNEHVEKVLHYGFDIKQDFKYVKNFDVFCGPKLQNRQKIVFHLTLLPT